MYESSFWVKSDAVGTWSLMYGWGERYASENKIVIPGLPSWRVAQSMANAFNNSQPTASQIKDVQREFPNLEIEE